MTAKDDIEELKTLALSNSLSRREKEILSRLLKYIRFNIQVSLFYQVLSSTQAIDKLITEIDNLINEYNETLLISEDETLKRRLKSKIKRLNKIKEIVSENNYEYFVKDIIDGVDNRQELIDMCAFTLSGDYQTYKKFFGKPLVENEKSSFKGFKINEETIEKVFSIITNRPLLVSITSYVLAYNKEKKILDRINELNDKNQYLELCLKNQHLIFAYLDALIKYKVKYEEYSLLNARYNQNRIVINSIDESNVFERLSKIYEKGKRKHENEEMEDELIKEKSLMNVLFKDLEKYQNELNKVSLEELSKVLFEHVTLDSSYVSYNSVDTSSPVLYASNVIFNGYSLSRQNQISDESEKCLITIDQNKRKIHLFEAKQEKLKHTRKRIYEKMDEDARSLIDNNLSDCINIVELTSSEKKFDVSPILSAYILKTIAKLKNIDFLTLNEEIDECVDVDAKRQEYESFINSKVEETYSQVDEIRDEVKPSIFNM